MKDLISVIVPIYNVEKYIDKCLNSIVNQTYKNIEIILIDDGSTDTSVLKCNNWEKKDNRIKVIHKKNEGLAQARNTGISYATGNYITFIDSDDYIDSKMLEKLYNAINKTNSEISACKYVKINKNKKVNLNYSAEIIEFTNKEAIIDLLKETNISNYAWNKLFKKELFKRN